MPMKLHYREAVFVESSDGALRERTGDVPNLNQDDLAVVSHNRGFVSTMQS